MLAAANILLAGKKGEFKGRSYINYYRLNNAIIKNIYPLSNAQFLQDRLDKTMIFTILDQ